MINNKKFEGSKFKVGCRFYSPFEGLSGVRRRKGGCYADFNPVDTENIEGYIEVSFC